MLCEKSTASASYTFIYAQCCVATSSASWQPVNVADQAPPAGCGRHVLCHRRRRRPLPTCRGAVHDSSKSSESMLLCLVSGKRLQLLRETYIKKKKPKANPNHCIVNCPWLRARRRRRRARWPPAAASPSRGARRSLACQSSAPGPGPSINLPPIHHTRILYGVQNTRIVPYICTCVVGGAVVRGGWR